MEDIFAKPPPSIPHHYKMLLQKKEAALSTLDDCFAPVTQSPTHLYTPKGPLFSTQKPPSVSLQQVRRSVVSVDSKRDEVEELKAEVSQLRQENSDMKERISKLESILKLNNIELC